MRSRAAVAGEVAGAVAGALEADYEPAFRKRSLYIVPHVANLGPAGPIGPFG